MRIDITGCSVSPPNMYLAHIASTAFPQTLSGCRSMTPSPRRSQLSIKVCLHVVAIGYALAPLRDCGVLYRSAIAAFTPDGAAIGWLQRISSRFQDGRASWPGRRGNSSRSSEGRVLGPRIGRLQRTVALWFSAGLRGRQCFPGARRVPDAFWTVRRPDAC